MANGSSSRKIPITADSSAATLKNLVDNIAPHSWQPPVLPAGAAGAAGLGSAAVPVAEPEGPPTGILRG